VDEVNIDEGTVIADPVTATAFPPDGCCTSLIIGRSWLVSGLVRNEADELLTVS